MSDTVRKVYVMQGMKILIEGTEYDMNSLDLPEADLPPIVELTGLEMVGTCDISMHNRPFGFCEDYAPIAFREPKVKDWQARERQKPRKLKHKGKRR